jgi:DnaK suppressor protein
MDITLDDIEAALARLDAGTYGACIRCGRTIMLKRLRALPYVSRCNRCMRALQELPTG